MKKIALIFIRAYQLLISPILGAHCRFAPSCSHYAAEAIEKKGVARGTLRSFFRLLRCNPLFPGGYDPV
ncbi:MAG: membrane protein insertion efficiency factor YidD [Candidatus Omnitrophica bacterium]|nr:membrane protein insertion efficiency factor YidD [Candidatus Omnitrophota bacterium]